MPPPTGVVRGPLIATLNSVSASRVSAGSHSPARSFAFSPANTSIQAISRRPPYALATAESTTCRVAAQMSGPIPSPSMKGMIGWSGTTGRPVSPVTLFPREGTEAYWYRDTRGLRVTGKLCGPLARYAAVGPGLTADGLNLTAVGCH